MNLQSRAAEFAYAVREHPGITLDALSQMFGVMPDSVRFALAGRIGHDIIRTRARKGKPVQLFPTEDHMRCQRPKHLGPTAKFLIGKLRQFGPLSVVGLADKTGLNADRLYEHLRIARNLGEAAPTRAGGRAPLWFVPEHKDRAMKMDADNLRELERARRLAENARARGYRQNGQESLGMDTFPVRRKIVKASEATPLRGLGPCSVFHLAA